MHQCCWIWNQHRLFQPLYQIWRKATLGVFFHLYTCNGCLLKRHQSRFVIIGFTVSGEVWKKQEVFLSYQLGYHLTVFQVCFLVFHLGSNITLLINLPGYFSVQDASFCGKLGEHLIRMLNIAVKVPRHVGSFLDWWPLFIAVATILSIGVVRNGKKIGKLCRTLLAKMEMWNGHRNIFIWLEYKW